MPNSLFSSFFLVNYQLGLYYFFFNPHSGFIKALKQKKIESRILLFYSTFAPQYSQYRESGAIDAAQLEQYFLVGGVDGLLV